MNSYVRITIAEDPGASADPSFVLQHPLDIDCAIHVPLGDELNDSTDADKAAYARYALAVAPKLRALADGLERS